MTGRRVSHYAIRRKIGEGGMGAVYEAVDERLGRRVALKFLSAGLLDSSDARARFAREARAISSLSHPNIGVLYDLVETEEVAFLVLEYLPGGTLRRRLHRLAEENRQVPVLQAVDWAGQIAAGLAHAHRKGIVHRDVKPSNLMFDEEDRLKITDFGLAKLREGGRLTGTGAALGTAAYLAPEQAVGSGEADHRADIFSFGVVFYEILANDLPFRADTQIGVLHKVLNEPPEPLAAKRPDLPEEVEQIVRRCLEKKPERRYQSATEVVADLRRVAGTTLPWARSETVRVAVSSADAPAETGGGAAPAPSAGILLRRRALTGLAVAAVVLLLLLAPGVRTGLQRWMAGLPEEQKLAVLLFENVGGGEEARAFADGLTETLTAAITQLQAVRGSLWVVPASEVRSQDVRSVREARRLLGVNLAVTGSVQRTQDGVRVTINLVDAGQARQLASRVLDSPAGELSGLERRLLGAVAEMLTLEVASGGALRASGTEVAAAFEHYLRGRGYLQRFDKPGYLDRAVEEFQGALEADPDYPAALAGLGAAYLARHEVTRELSWLTEARRLNQRAAALDPSLAEAHLNLCRLYTRLGRFDLAIDAGRKALEIDPLNAEAYRALAGAFDQAGRYEEAEATYRSAIDLQPDSWLAHKDLGVYCFHRSRLADAEREFQRVIELTPDNEWGYRNLAAVYQTSGRWDEAEEMLARAVEVRPTAVNLSNLGALYYSLGRYREAAETFERAVQLSPEDPVVRGNLADAYRAIPGRERLAEAAYRQAIEIGERKLAVNRRDPLLLTVLAVYSAKLGKREAALTYLAEAEFLGELPFHLKYQAAVVRALTGDIGGALESLKEAVEAGYPVEEAVRDRELAPLRKEPEFQQIVANRGGVQ